MLEFQVFAYRVHPVRSALLSDGPTPEEIVVLGEHFSYLQGLMVRGVLILAGRTMNTDPSAFGLVVFRAATEEEAREIMQADPAVARGMMGASLFPYRIVMMSEANVP